MMAWSSRPEGSPGPAVLFRDPGGPTILGKDEVRVQRKEDELVEGMVQVGCFPRAHVGPRLRQVLDGLVSWPALQKGQDLSWHLSMHPRLGCGEDRFSSCTSQPSWPLSFSRSSLVIGP